MFDTLKKRFPGLYDFYQHTQRMKILKKIKKMENVPELVNEKVFCDFVDTLKRLKYNVTYNIVNAADSVSYTHLTLPTIA